MFKKINRAYQAGGLRLVAAKTVDYTKNKFCFLFLRSLPLIFYRWLSVDNRLVKKIQSNLMLLDLTDEGINCELAATGVHEKESTAQIKKEVKPGMIVLELGANVGYYALIEAKLVGPTGKIIAIEPSPINLQLLHTNVLLNDLEDRFEFHHKAIGNKNSREKFYVSNRGNLSSFIKRDEGKFIHSIKEIDVEMQTLDSFLCERKIDYLRMDIEGFEWEALEGMQNLLSSSRAPRGMYIEVHSELLNHNGHSAKAFLEKLQEFGYDISRSFYRGRADISCASMQELLSHPRVEAGYWETFFIKK